MNPVLVLVDPQLAVSIHSSLTVATLVDEGLVLVLTLHMVQHVTLEFADLWTDCALPPLETTLHDACHVGQEDPISLQG